jgi:hypothetical protein
MCGDNGTNGVVFAQIGHNPPQSFAVTIIQSYYLEDVQIDCADLALSTDEYL